MTRSYQVDHVKVVFLDNQIGVCMNEIESWTGTPMTYSWLFVSYEFEREYSVISAYPTIVA
jgi:hypothetical protein